MTTRLDVLAAMRAGRWPEALALAARFPHLGAQRVAIQRAHAVLTQPAFYRELHVDAGMVVAAGVAALKARYGA